MTALKASDKSVPKQYLSEEPFTCFTTTPPDTVLPYNNENTGILVTILGAGGGGDIQWMPLFQPIL